MRRLGSILQWLSRQALLYVVLVLALFAAPSITMAWNRAADFQGLDAAHKQLLSGRDEWVQEVKDSTEMLDGATNEELKRRIDATGNRIEDEQKRLKADKKAVELLRRGPKVLLENEQRKLKIARLQLELDTLKALRYLRDAKAGRARLDEARVRCADAKADLKALDDRLSYRLRSWIRESSEHKKLRHDMEDACREAREGLSTQSVQQAEKKYEDSKRNVEKSFDDALSGLADERDEAEILWNGTRVQKVRLWAEERNLDTILLQALVALVLIWVTPFLIRLLFWCVFAPLVGRTHAIRVAVPGGPGATIPMAERSTTAVSIRLAADEELLARQSYLQTTPHGGSKATQWLLDWRHPLASIVSGLTFLTRIRGTDERATVSAVEDPFAEVTVLTLPEGASCVLQPRALAAVVQQTGRPLRVKSHWRLRSLNAWLTLQFRFLVFHGPCRLVIKGGRGVRVERAERGRIFGQAQLIGFSTDLDYSVTRAETFWPYFVGREQLFKDKVTAGAGVLVLEEVPMAGRKNAGGRRRRGLEGAFEVITKAVGI